MLKGKFLRHRRCDDDGSLGFVMVVAMVVVVLLSLIGSEGYYGVSALYPENNFPKGDIVGAWIDNKNRTVYVCGCDVSLCNTLSFAISEPGAPANLTRFGTGQLSLLMFDGKSDAFGKVFYLDTRSGGNGSRIREYDWKLDQNGDKFEGKIDDSKWILRKRIYEREPGPSMCWKIASAEKSPKVVGKWQRITSSGDIIYFSMCGDGKGYYQSSLKGTTIRLIGNVNNTGFTWYGKRHYINFTTGDRTLLGSAAYAQVGSTILTEVIVDFYGNYVERNTYSYIGLPDYYDCDAFPIEKFPIPYKRMSLFAYIIILIIGYFLMRYMPSKHRLAKH